MPLPNLIKNLIANSRDKLNQIESNESSKASKSSVQNRRYSSSSSSNLSFINDNSFLMTSRLSNQNNVDQHNIAINHQQQPHKTTLSQINGLHSHRNLKPSYQMLLAESMYDECFELSLDSCLTCSFDDCISDNNNSSNYQEHYSDLFIQFMESLNADDRPIIKCFIQTNCLLSFIEEKFENQWSKDHHEENYRYFLTDFKRIFTQLNDQMNSSPTTYNRTESIAANKLQSKSVIEIDSDVQSKVIQLFDYSKSTNNQINEIETLKLFKSFRQLLKDRIENDYYEKFLRSNFCLKYEYEILKTRKFRLSDILFTNRSISSIFIDFMANENMKNFIDFLLQYRNYILFSKQYQDAWILYNRFFTIKQQNNPRLVNDQFLPISEQLLQQLQTSFVDDKFEPNCFDKIANMIMQYFSKTYLPQFIDSNYFMDYLDDCRQKLTNQSLRNGQATISQPSPKSRTNNNNEKSNVKTSLQSIDILDPNNHTTTSNKDRLQFTYIDQYGRMNSELDRSSLLHNPQPQLSNSLGILNVENSNNKLSKFINRLSSFKHMRTSSKESEDDAWRIAESIINDVCSATNRQQQQQSNEFAIEFDS